MGIFDRFKKKKSPSTTPPPNTGSGPSPDFKALYTYREYLIAFMNMQMQGNYAPISAFQNPDGSLTGYLFVIKDPSMEISVEECLERMETEFEKRMAEGKIISYAIFYHSQWVVGGSHAVAHEQEELKAITIKYKLKGGDMQYRAVGYTFEDDSLSFHGLPSLSQDENNQIFGTQLQEGVDYFEEKVDLEPEIVENEHGIKVQQVTTGSMENTWCGIFGFEHFRNEGGGDFLMEQFALLVSYPPVSTTNGLSAHEEAYGSVSYRALTSDEQALTIMPVVHSNFCIPCTIKKIQEWAHVDGIEAIVTAGGRDTFGLWFFATDYAEKNARYQSNKQLDICLSGIVFVLDTYKNDRPADSEVSFSDDFTSYMPNNDLPDLGCFDFIGVVIDVQETTYSPRPGDKGYIMTTRLITNPDDPNFFTIPLFVNPKNMRFEGIKVGMKVTGMFQLQGQIAEQTR